MFRSRLLFFLVLLLQIVCPSLSVASPYQVESIPYGNYLAPDRLTIIVSFDGSRDLDRWQEILDFASEHQVKMTFYVSGVYFLTDQEKDRYSDPVAPERKGVSMIGFGGNDAMVERRKGLVSRSLAAGHAIESHLNGHFDASRWSSKEWEREFASFDALTAFLPAQTKHVRFPLLAMNDRVYPVMAEFGARTITSVAGKDPTIFKKVTLDYRGTPYTFLEFPIPVMQEGTGRFLLMDYNIYLNDKNHRRSGAAATAKTVELYLSEAERCLREQRPLFISHHFSPWNDDAYWEAIRQVVPLLKARYQVDFVTIDELYALLGEKPVRAIGG